jgi:tight adherence protein B
MGALLGLGVALGGLLIFLGITTAPRSRAPRASRLRRLIDKSGDTRLTPGNLVMACVAAGLVALLAVLALTSVPAVAIVAGVLIGLLPIGLLSRRATRRVKSVRACWPDAVDTLASAVKAGMSLPEAVADLALRGPEPLRPAFAQFTREYRACGSFDVALGTLQQQVRDAVADRVVAALRVAREVGGTDLGKVLTTLSDFLRTDARTRGEIEARQSWTVNAARVAVAAPWITLLLLSTRPEAAAAYSTPTGALIIVGSALLSVIAYRVMIAMGRLPDDPRVMIDPRTSSAGVSS